MTQITEDPTNPENLTLKFRMHKTTILLSCSPLSSLSSLQTSLLSILNSTNISVIHGVSVPEDSRDIDLGVGDNVIGFRELGMDIYESIEVDEVDEAKTETERLKEEEEEKKRLEAMSPAERREKEREERVRGKKGKGIGEKRTGKLANGKLVNGMGEEAILLKEGVEEGELLAFKFKGEEWDSCVASDD